MQLTIGLHSLSVVLNLSKLQQRKLPPPHKARKTNDCKKTVKISQKNGRTRMRQKVTIVATIPRIPDAAPVCSTSGAKGARRLSLTLRTWHFLGWNEEPRLSLRN